MAMRAAKKVQPVKKASAVIKSSNESINTTEIPLFKLAELTPKDRQVNVKKLRAFFEKHGQYPAHYRSMIWRFLLRLPENSEAFSDLVRRGVHPSFQGLYRQYPLSSKRLFRRLQNTCSQLAHWAPIFGEVSYLPQLVFPFIIVFANDELAALETCMTILMWWGYSWHVTFPHPPVHITKAIDTILALHDENLHSHMTLLGASPGLLGWSMITSLFTELLSKEDWLKLMDYLFSHISNSGLVILTVVAILRHIRTSLLSAGDASHINNYCRLQQGVRIEEIIRMVDFMSTTTPPKHLVACTGSSSLLSSSSTKKVVLVHGRRGVGVEGDLYDDEDLLNDCENDEMAGAADSLSKCVGKATFPLPAGRYPAYDGHPSFLVDWELKKRDRALALQEEVERREDVLQQLQSKILEMESEHSQWMLRHQAASEGESRHRKSIMEAEKKHLLELQQIEQSISQQRVESLVAMERVAAEEMSFMDTISKEARQLLEEGEAHLKEKINLAMNVQKHRELSETAEQMAYEKMRKLRMGRSRDEWVKGLESALRGKEEDLEAKNAVLRSEWEKQDELIRMQRQQRTELHRKLQQDQELKQLQEETSTRLLRLQQQREAKIIDIERSRAIRLAKEQSEEAIEAASRTSNLLLKKEMASSVHEASLLSDRNIQEAKLKLQEAINQVHQESENLLLMEQALTVRHNSNSNSAVTVEQANRTANQQIYHSGIPADKEVLKKPAVRIPASHQNSSDIGGSVHRRAVSYEFSSSSSDSETENIPTLLGAKLRKQPLKSVINRADKVLNRNEGMKGPKYESSSSSSEDKDVVGQLFNTHQLGQSTHMKNNSFDDKTKKTYLDKVNETKISNESFGSHTHQHTGADSLWEAMAHEFDEFVKIGGIGAGPRPHYHQHHPGTRESNGGSSRGSSSTSDDSALWAFDDNPR